MLTTSSWTAGVADLEAFAMNLHEDAAAIAKAHGKDRRRVLKDYFHSRDA